MLYYLTPSLRVKNYVLLAASLLFYALGEPVYILLMVFASFSAFFFAKRIAARRTKLLLAASVAVNVSCLFFFKYFPLFLETANAAVHLNLRVPQLALPIGISFYTFQILTYTIDIYYGKTPVQKSFLTFLLYVSLFPQLIAGPIVRYSDVEAQLGARTLTVEKFARGVTCFVCGLAKKVILADYAGKIADSLLTGAQPSTLGAWVGILMYTFQIYFDFSGYSDMAIGLGRMFGFEYAKNFDYPYISKSITEFWRRWHMSLGTFFRDYVYIPLGGNKKHQMLNIAAVWILTGFWHGASWSFALWGAYFGALIIAEKYVFQKIRIKLPAAARWLYCFLAVAVGWNIFYFTDLTKMALSFRAMFSYIPADGFLAVMTAKENAAFLLVCLFASMPAAKTLYARGLDFLRGKSASAAGLLEAALPPAYTVCLLAACSAILAGSSFSPFLYFRF
ncbi:MAG: MBOAT family protein [Oscillospiraceae bacterium]|nr:MBOAT family protein [Oscillospiraceae bacterium]